MAQPQQLNGIQYLRGIAVLFVVLDHCTGIAMLPKYFGGNMNIFDGWLHCGSVGVDLFFVISGFIIYYVSLNADTLKPKIGTKQFFINRFIRIVPLMWLSVIGIAILQLFGRGTFPLFEYVRSLTLFPIGTVNPRSIWTLRHELLFYLLFGFLIIKYDRKWFWLVLWFLSPFIFYGFTFLYWENSARFNLLAFLFSVHNLTFGIGFFIGYLYKKGYLSRAINTNWGFLILLAASVPLLFVAHALHVDGSTKTFTQVILCGLVSAAIVILAIVLIANRPSNLLGRSGLLLGNASYAIYLVHPPVISAIVGIMASHHPHINPVVLLLMLTVFTTMAGIAVHLFVEKPLIRLIKSRWNNASTSSN